MLILQIDYLKTASPSSIGVDEGDNRVLAVFFRSLKVEYQGGEIALDFSASSSLCEATLFGFWQPETEGTWSAGARSALVFDVPVPSARILRITLEAHSFEQAFPTCEIQLATSSGHRSKAKISGMEKLEIVLKKTFVTKSCKHVLGNTNSLDRRGNVSLCQDAPKVSTIFLNRDKPLMTRTAAIAVATSKLAVPFEILCVDNGSTAENLSKLQQSEVEMRLLELQENKGYGEANNLAAMAARGEFLLFLNNDAFIQPGAVREMLFAFHSIQDCGAVGAVLRYPDGRIQEAGCTLHPDGTAIRRGRDDPYFRRDSLPRFEAVDYVSGACIMIKREDFIEMGGFDPIYSPAYYEDTDFCLRLREKGKSVYLASRAECFHIENATSRSMESADWITRQVETNRLKLLRRWINQPNGGWARKS